MSPHEALERGSNTGRGNKNIDLSEHICNYECHANDSPKYVANNKRQAGVVYAYARHVSSG